MIISAKEVWNNQKNREEFDRCCESVMRKIQQASDRGLRDCCFSPSVAAHYNAVKAEFEKFGYRFVPTGVIGGVRQDCEQICW